MPREVDMAEPTQDALFICYSHTDQKYREQFSKFLQAEPLRHVKIFSDAAIQAGDDWYKIILERLQEATAALVLVSQDFMISPFIQQTELRQILENHIRRGLRLFLVPVRPTNYQGTYLERFQWARPPDRPLSLLPEPEQEAAMVEVCLRIAGQLTTKADAPTIEQTIECLKSIPKLDLPSMYELIRPIGEGQFARCYKAHDHLLDREVIIKVLNTELSRDSPAYDKYVRSASKLHHRNILGLLFSQANKLPHFIVTPDVGDLTLEKRLTRSDGATPPSFKEAVECTIRLAATLGYAHRQKCVHGRLRPSEVRFDGEGEPMLSGFRTIEACTAPPPGADARLSLEDFQYSSPEHRECGVVDVQSDQYLLGLLAYEMFAGAPPFKIASWASVLNPVATRALLDPRPLKDVVQGCDEAVSNVVMRMLNVDPGARWDSLETVRKKLEEALSKTSRVEEAKDSYRRCARQDRFYEDLYTHLFAEMPDIRGMFTRRTMKEQYQVLSDALWLLLTFPDAQEHGEPTILSGIARSHERFEPRHFDQFRDAVLKAVATHDPKGATAVAAWRDVMQPGLEYLKSRTGKAVSAGP
jgi:serine/threonine protein kinase